MQCTKKKVCMNTLYCIVVLISRSSSSSYSRITIMDGNTVGCPSGYMQLSTLPVRSTKSFHLLELILHIKNVIICKNICILR